MRLLILRFKFAQQCICTACASDPFVFINYFSFNIIFTRVPHYQCANNTLSLITISYAFIFFISSECIVYFKNIGTLPIEMLEVIVESQLDPNQQRHVVQWSEKTLQDQLPLTSGATAELSLFLFGASNFLVQPSTNIQGIFRVLLK